LNIKPLLILTLLPCYLFSQELRKIDNNVFRKGEYLKFEAYYHSLLTGRVTAGLVTLEVKNESTKFYDRNALHIEGIGKTKGFFNLFYKVIDRYDTYIDDQAIIPWKFVRRVNEGDYRIYQDIFFDHFNKKATLYNYHNGKVSSDNDKRSVVSNRQISIPAYTQDIVSAFYYARTFDLADIKPGKEFPVQFMLDDSVYVTKIIYEGKAEIKTRLGTFRCMKFKPMVLKGNVFSEPYPMTLYISDDNNRIPILAESSIIVGTVKLELMKYSNLLNPVSSQIK
jgi:hypothetical protein